MGKNYLLIWQEGKKDSRKKNEIDSDEQNKGKKREKVRNTTKKKMRCFKMVISHAIIIYKFL